MIGLKLPVVSANHEEAFLRGVPIAVRPGFQLWRTRVESAEAAAGTYGGKPIARLHAGEAPPLRAERVHACDTFEKFDRMDREALKKYTDETQRFIERKIAEQERE